MNSDLLDIAAIADLIGLTAGSVKQLSTHGLLPKPDMTVGRVKLWKKATIFQWDSQRLKRYDNRKATT